MTGTAPGEAPSRPTLVVVSGPAGGYGKTTLAHELARAIGCPAICRDEIKEGMVHAGPAGFAAAPGDPATRRTFPLFFEVLELLLRGGVTTVAEAAFQGPVWRPGLERLAGLADLRIVRCVVDPATANERNRSRAAASARRRRAHGSKSGPLPAVHPFEPIAVGAPSITVDTTDGYDPGVGDIVAFVEDPAAGRG